MASRDAFVALEAFVRAPDPAPGAGALVPVAPPEQLAEALHEVRRFRAALADALESALEDVLRDLASDVLARELVLAPAEIARVARTALERLWEEPPLAILAHPEEIAVLGELAVPVHGDASLRRGDVTIALRYGSIDLTLGARLAYALEHLR